MSAKVFTAMIGSISATLAACVSAPAAPKTPTPFVFTVRGDDGLTQRLTMAILSELAQASDLVGVTVDGNGVLQIAIPTHARAEVDPDSDAAVALALGWSGDGATSLQTLTCRVRQLDDCGRKALETVRRYIATSRSALSGSDDQ